MFVRGLSIAFAGLVFSATVIASTTVSTIKFEGLYRVTSEQLVGFDIAKVGMSLNEANSNAIISKLYESGYFSDIQLFTQNNTLIIKVKERPVIAKVSF